MRERRSLLEGDEEIKKKTIYSLKCLLRVDLKDLEPPRELMDSSGRR